MVDGLCATLTLSHFLKYLTVKGIKIICKWNLETGTGALPDRRFYVRTVQLSLWIWQH